MIVVAPVQIREERVGRSTQATGDFPGRAHRSYPDSRIAGIVLVQTGRQPRVIRPQFRLHLCRAREARRSGSARDVSVRRRPRPGFKENHLCRRILRHHLLIEKIPEGIMFGAVILQHNEIPKLGIDRSQGRRVRRVELVIHSTYRAHHHIGISLPSRLREPIKNCRHRRRLADGEAIPDEENRRSPRGSGAKERREYPSQNAHEI